MAGVLSLLGLLSDPEELQRLRLAEEEAAAAAAAAARLRAARPPPAAPAPAPPAPAAAAAAPAAAAPAPPKRAPEAALQQEALDALEAMEAMEAAGLGDVPAGRSPAEAVQAAAAPDMSEVDMRGARSAALRARQPKALRSADDLQPRHTARPDLTAAANAVHMPPAPVAFPPPVPEAAAGEEFDANVAFAMQAGAGHAALLACGQGEGWRCRRGWCCARCSRRGVPCSLACSLLGRRVA